MKSARTASVFLAVMGVAMGCANLAVNGAGHGDSVTAEPIGSAAPQTPIAQGAAATGYPEAVAVNMFTPQGVRYACSGVVIAPRVVLTAGHCVDGYDRWEVYAGMGMQVSTRGVTYDWAEHGSTAVNPAHHDLGLVFLASAVSLAQYPSLASSAIPDGSMAVDIGRIHDGAITTSEWQTAVTLTRGVPYGYPYDYAGMAVTAHGDSGGGVFAAGTHQLVAVNSGTGSSVEVVARVDLVHAWLEAQIAANGGPGTVSSTPTAPVGSPTAGASTHPTGATVPSGCVAAPAGSTSMNTATPLGGCAHGTLNPAGSSAFLDFSASPAVPYTLLLTSTADAVLTVGVVTPTANGETCVPVAHSATGLRVTVQGTPRVLCAVVSSSQHTPQSWVLSRVQ